MPRILKQLIVEVKFTPRLKFHDRITQIFDDLIVDYTAMENSASRIVLKHETTGAEIFCENIRAGVAYYNIESEAAVRAEFRKVSEIVRAVEPKKILRLGVRLIGLLPIKTEREKAIATYLDNQFKNENLISGRYKINDFAITLEGDTENSSIRIITAIISKNEINERHPNFTIGEVPDVSVLIDVDNYILDMPSKISETKIADLYKYNVDLIESNLEKYGKLFS